MRNIIIKWVVRISHVWYRLRFIVLLKVFKKVSNIYSIFIFINIIFHVIKKKHEQSVFIIIYFTVKTKKKHKGYQTPSTTQLTFQSMNNSSQKPYIYLDFKMWAYIDYNIFVSSKLDW